MKKFVIVVLVLILVGVGVLVFAVSRAGSIIADYKPELEQLASDSLGSTVTLGDLSVSIFPNAQVVIDSAKVANIDDPDETITVEQVSLSLELIPLLTGDIVITELDVYLPNITIVREEEGIFVEGLPRAADTKASTSGTPASTEAPSEATSAGDIPVTVDLKSFNLKNATLLWKNTIGDMDYTVEKLDLSASFTFADDQAVFSNVDGSGIFMRTVDFEYSGDELRYGLKDGIIGLKQLSATSLGSTVTVAGELSQDDTSKTITIASKQGIVLDEMTPLFEIFAPAAVEFGVKGTLKPSIQFAFTPKGYNSTGSLTVSGLAAGVEELIGFDNLGGDFTVNADEANQSVKSENLAGQLNGAPFKVTMAAALNPTTGQVEPFVMGAFGGESKLSTKLALDDPAYPFSSTLSSGGMFIEQLIPALAPDMPIAITGTVKELSGSIGGTLNENMMASLKGSSRVLIGNGLIKDVNLGQQILRSVTDLPFISGALLSVVPAELQSFLAKDHTVLSEVSGTFALENELMTSNDMKVISDFFEFEATGTIGLDTNVNLDSVIHFNKTFSDQMVDEVKELHALQDNQGRITFPVRITGIPPES